ncbi:MAG: 3-dehydroquinate synthase [Planctomycetota bacterium]|jgi:3-dehydroquinate synthase
MHKPNASQSDPLSGNTLDVPFAVPFIHRLRFTGDAFGADAETLAGVLETSNDGPAKVQFWVDQNVADANPDLQHKIRRFVSNHTKQITMPGNIQFVSGGEVIKNDIHVIERMLKVINAADLDRRSYIIVIGGGAVLDCVGFAAAIAHRGIRLVRLPTTTLAQGDSGVGVKNGVNLFGKKNWVGAFATPWAVINDTKLLETLPDRDFRAGFSEAVKVFLLKDPTRFHALCESATKIRNRDMSVAGPTIESAARWHLNHITRGGDPYEALEARPLDYGHWSAHKMEPMSEFELPHGEAVGIGVAVDTVYSSLVHGLPEADAQRALRCLADLGMPLDHWTIHDTEHLFDGLEEFRQHLGGRLTVTMLKGVGQPIDVHQVDRPRMLEAIEYVSAFGKQHAAKQL